MTNYYFCRFCGKPADNDWGSICSKCRKERLNKSKKKADFSNLNDFL